MNIDYDYNDYIETTAPMPLKKLTKIDGPPDRHLEQLWDEVKRLNERVLKLEKLSKQV